MSIINKIDLETVKKYAFYGLVGFGALKLTHCTLVGLKNTINKAIKSFQSLNSIYNNPEKPSYAVITGGTDGIGFEFAKSLAQENFNLVLLARKPEGLDKAANALKEINPKIDVVKIQADFSKSDNPELWEKIDKQIAGLDIGFLVNNVGKYYWGDFDKMKESDINLLMNLNIFATTHMTRLVIPKMLERKQKSAVINIGSFTGEVSMPKTAVNCGSKKYVHYFTQCLAAEYYKENIDFLAIVPGFTETGGLDRFQQLKMGNPVLTSPPTEVVAAALRDVKIANQIGNQTGGTFNHKLFTSLMTTPIFRSIIAKKVFGIDI